MATGRERREPQLLMPNLGAPKALPRDLTVRGEGVSSDQYAEAREVLYSLFHKWGRSEVEFARNRYVFHVLPINTGSYSGWKTDTWCRVLIEPIGGKLVQSEYHLEKHYRAPRKALEHGVPEDSRLSYRGMSWEEWQFIRRTGKIASAGWYNLGQEGYTFFGKAEQAEHYASGFTPWLYKPGKKCPGVVIAIPRDLTLDERHDRENIPHGERAIKGAVSAGEIVGVWYLLPVIIYMAQAEIKRDGKSGHAEVYGGSTPSVYHATIEADDWYG